MVGVAQFQGSSWYAVKAHHQQFVATVSLPVALNDVSQCSDIARVGVVVVDKAQLRYAASAQGPCVNRIEHACGGGGRILWVGGNHQHAVYAFVFEFIQHLCNSWGAIAHHQADLNPTVAPLLMQGIGLALRPHFQRRAFLGPDAGVFLRRLGWAHPQNDAVQNEQPQKAGDFHHPGVA